MSAYFVGQQQRTRKLAFGQKIIFVSLLIV
jgi:hypothetical protein